MGHNFKGTSVIEHSYFGSSKIIDDLKTLDGWNEGIVKIGALDRSSETGMIHQIASSKSTQVV